jgi:tRNA threonylcarbamoyladenosine biosynthesis protein TsaE
VTGASSIQLRSPGVDTTRDIAAALAGLCRSGDLLVLAGEMGAGKTAFAQGFGRGLGVTEPVTSPTFTLVHSYSTGRVELHHVDVYRLERTAEVADLALAELLESNAMVLVEWGDVVAVALGDHLEVRLEWVDLTDTDHRRITIRPAGHGWATRWSQLHELVSPWREGQEPC